MLKRLRMRDIDTISMLLLHFYTLKREKSRV